MNIKSMESDPIDTSIPVILNSGEIGPREMKKNIENLINPAWPETVRQLEQVKISTQLALKPLSESASMKSIRKIMESSQIAALAFQESETMKSFRRFAEQSQVFASAFQESEVGKQIQKFAELGQLNNFALQQSAAFKHLSKLTNLESRSYVQVFFAALK